MPNNVPGFNVPPNLPKVKIDSSSPQAFFNSLYPVAEAWGRANGISPQLLLAINASESGYGSTSTLFGIKGKGTSYGTWEQGPNGERIQTTDSFRTYNDPNEAYRDFFQFIQDNNLYWNAWTKFKQTGDDKQLIRDLNRPIPGNDIGYATDKNWASKVINHSSQIQVQPSTIAPETKPPTATPTPELTDIPATSSSPNTPDPAIQSQPGTGPYIPPPVQTTPNNPQQAQPQSPTSPVPNTSPSPTTTQAGMGSGATEAGLGGIAKGGVSVAGSAIGLTSAIISKLMNNIPLLINFLNIAYNIDEQARNNYDYLIHNTQRSQIDLLSARMLAQAAYANAQFNLANDELNRAKWINDVNTRNATRILPKGTEYMPGFGPDSLMAQAAGMLGVKYEPVKVSEVDKYKLDPLVNIQQAGSTQNQTWKKLTPDDYGVNKFDQLQSDIKNTKWSTPLEGPEALVRSWFGDTIADGLGFARRTPGNNQDTSATWQPAKHENPIKLIGENLGGDLKGILEGGISNAGNLISPTFTQPPSTTNIVTGTNPGINPNRTPEDIINGLQDAASKGYK